LNNKDTKLFKWDQKHLLIYKQLKIKMNWEFVIIGKKKIQKILRKQFKCNNNFKNNFKTQLRINYLIKRKPKAFKIKKVPNNGIFI